jgi:UrcA family protein
MKTHIAKVITRLFGTALIAGAVLGGQAFAAGPFNEARSTVVKFGDLNLETPQGVAALYRRIHNAAKQVCGVVPEDNVFLEAAAQEGKCMAESEARAIDDIHNVALEAYYSKKTGRAMPVLASNQK